jgi:hypothetical protein
MATTKPRRSRTTASTKATPAETAPDATAAVTATPDAEATPANGVTGNHSEPGPVAPTSAPPAGNTDHLKVVIVAGVLGDQPDDGMTGPDVVNASGLQPGLVAKILAAMEVTGVARRLPPDEDGTERWVRGEGDLASVDVGNAPTHRTCPTCGHTRRISVKFGGRRNGGAAEQGFNSDGQRKLRKGELYTLTREFVTSRPVHVFAAGDIARELGHQEGRTISSGAVQNALDIMLTRGEVRHANPDDPHDRKVTAPSTEPATAG